MSTHVACGLQPQLVLVVWQAPVRSVLQCSGAEHHRAFVEIRDITFIGGFQSPMEKEFLTFILRGTASVIICPARGIARMRLPAAWRTPLETGRLLLLSPFPANVHRPTHQTATQRNALVAELATSLLVPHAAPGGKVEQLCQDALAQGTPVFTLPSANQRLADLDAAVCRVDNLPNLLPGAR